MKTFHTIKWRAYPHKKLNTSKAVIRSRELALAAEEEIASALGKQGVKTLRRITISKGEERIKTNAYILTFNQPHSDKKVKIDFCLERFKQYVSDPEVLQIPKIWTPQESLERTTGMSPMW